jgi:DNA-binding LacI/PurR family transcriptional regulator
MNRQPVDPAFSAVDVDTRPGVQAALRHLHDRGHQRIGMIDCPAVKDPARRAAFLAGEDPGTVTVSGSLLVRESS